jgi:ubiquinone/menaquinone biosynthesis C-methylase UbiE
MDDFQLLVQFHLDANRQGPGGEKETLRAIELAGLDDSQKLKIADIGCGTGASTIILAKNLNAEITAIDLFPEFLEVLKSQVSEHKLKGQVTSNAFSMEDMPFDKDELDVIWSEGAIYNIGFERGIKEWKPFLKKGGILAVSEITWLTATRPNELEEHWKTEYPEIGMASEKIKVLENNGYKLVGYFPLPTPCWLENYYSPMEARFESFLTEQSNSEEAEQLVEGEQKEIDLYNKYSDYYSYGFYVAQKQ